MVKRTHRSMLQAASVALTLLALPLASLAAEVPAAASAPVDWQSWTAGNNVGDLASLQRGARNFMNYCQGCHSLKYERYQRMATDLKIPAGVLTQNLVPPGSSPLDYIGTPMPTNDAVTWFGKAPPDLSDIVRYLGADYIYRYLRTFYADPTSATGSNNLANPNVAMPDVLSDLEGVKQAVYRTVKGPDGQSAQVLDHFVTTVPGNMSPDQFDGFVRDTVNFLDYVGEPAQVQRRSMGIWVALFLAVMTGFAWLLKKEYWKDVH